MEAKLIQRGHSHASCHSAVTMAAKALLGKLPNSPDELKILTLEKDELDLLNKVIEKFGTKEEKKQDH